MTLSLIHDLLTILAAGLVAGLICRSLRISILIGYLVVGVLLGRGLLGWVDDEGHQLEHVAEAGVFLLLFSIGLEFSLDDLRRLGRIFLIGGSVQMTLVAVPVLLILLITGMAWQPATLIATAVAFSSTVLVFKALLECGQSEQPHGQGAIAILLFQDAMLIPLILLIPILTGAGDGSHGGAYLSLALISVLFVGAVILLRQVLGRWVIPLFAAYRSPELVILFTLVCLVGVTLTAYAVNLPPAVGAFAAGLIFNGNRWTNQIEALVLPFRETFAAVFFVSLGLIFNPQVIWSEPLWMSAALLGTLALKALAATAALRITGLSIDRAVGMGVGLAHVGEFAFVLALLGFEAGLIEERDYQRVVAVAVGSLIVTPPLIKWGLRLSRGGMDAAELPTGSISVLPGSTHAMVIGAGPIGRQVASQLETIGTDVCLVDLSPINLHPFAQEGFRTVAGNAMEGRILELAGVRNCSILAVCVPSDDSAVQIVKAIRKLNREGTLLVRCRYRASAEKLKAAGADKIVSEEVEASTALLRILDDLVEQSEPSPPAESS